MATELQAKISRIMEKWKERDLGLRYAVTLVAVCLAVLHFIRPDMTIDSVTVVLLIVAVLPWAQPLVKSIELLGVKLELQELQKQVADAKGAAESALSKAAMAVPSSEPAVPGESTDAAIKAADDVLQELAAEYERIRDTQKSGSVRTAAMTAVVRRLIELVPQLETFDVAQALRDARRGIRLAAYAYLYAKPDPTLLEAVVDSVTRLEDKPFGQYWGLQAITQVLTKHAPAPVPQTVVGQLRRFAERVPRGTDRDYELRKMLAELDREERNHGRD